MRALTPWTGIASLRQEMDRFFERFIEPRWGDLEVAGDWTPKIEVAETRDAVVVKAELPGVEPNDAQVTLQDDVLTIKGEKRHEKEEKDEQYHRVERSYGAFVRTVQLPAAVDASKVTAAFKDGLLTVTLPKSPSAKGTTIPIKAA